MDLIGIGIAVLGLLFLLLLHPALRPHAAAALVVVGLAMLGYGVVLFFHETGDSGRLIPYAVIFSTMGLFALYWGRQVLRGGRESEDLWRSR